MSSKKILAARRNLPPSLEFLSDDGSEVPRHDTMNWDEMVRFARRDTDSQPRVGRNEGEVIGRYYFNWETKEFTFEPISQEQPEPPYKT